MTSVRLGNILGSYGSVVPLFAEQIRRGGPVTVTHPEVSRYFFSISQAVELIIAAAEAESGGILVPQVHEPVKILELARQMISDADSQSGIEIVFTGLRAGDKLSLIHIFSLWVADRNHTRKKLMITAIPAAEQNRVFPDFARLETGADFL